MNKPLIGISIGDLNGISIEVILKTFRDERMYDICTPIIYGSSKAISYHKNILKEPDFKFNLITSADQAQEKTLNIINCWQETININIGTADKNSGSYVLKALHAVADDAIRQHIDAVITAPVNKSVLDTPQEPFLGQTEFFAKKCNHTQNLMFLVSERMKVGLVTNHVPVSEIAAQISKEKVIQKINLINEALRRDFLIERPKIAVLALNPHAGDDGLIGKEDDTVLRPALEQAKQAGMLAFGPYAADGFFGTGIYKEFDAVLAMYHDQGLIPFKLLSFGFGVNYTAGLPFVRTSPDHGTAYDIAGKGIAKHDSFRQAVFEAIDIVNNRRSYDAMHANSLKRTQLEREVDA